jgi:hypothetical protein
VGHCFNFFGGLCYGDAGRERKRCARKKGAILNGFVHFFCALRKDKLFFPEKKVMAAAECAKKLRKTFCEKILGSPQISRRPFGAAAVGVYSESRYPRPL